MQRMFELKSGVKTSEFWLSLLTLAAGVTDLIALPVWVYPVIPIFYTLARSWAKKQ